VVTGSFETLSRRGPDFPNNHLDDPWSVVADFPQHQYCKRACVLQKVVFVDRLVFISPGEANLTWSTLHDIHQGTDIIARTRDDTKRLDFLLNTAWDLLSSPLPWGLICWLFLAQTRTKIPHPDGFKGWIVSTFTTNLEATDHRDHIHGLLGVSDIPISPNYSTENNASHVCTKYIAGWLKAARSQKNKKIHVHTPLAFPSLAGVGDFGESDLPSWVPNYPKRRT
jgi:hypothetical protein